MAPIPKQTDDQKKAHALNSEQFNDLTVELRLIALMERLPKDVRRNLPDPNDKELVKSQLLNLVTAIDKAGAILDKAAAANPPLKDAEIDAAIKKELSDGEQKALTRADALLHDAKVPARGETPLDYLRNIDREGAAHATQLLAAREKIAAAIFERLEKQYGSDETKKILAELDKEFGTDRSGKVVPGAGLRGYATAYIGGHIENMKMGIPKNLRPIEAMAERAEIDIKLERWAIPAEADKAWKQAMDKKKLETFEKWMKKLNDQPDGIENENPAMPGGPAGLTMDDVEAPRLPPNLRVTPRSKA